MFDNHRLSPYNNSQPSENPDLEEAKSSINLDYQEGLKNNIHQLIKDTFGEHFNLNNLDDRMEEMKLELEGLEDFSFLVEDSSQKEV